MKGLVWWLWSGVLGLCLAWSLSVNAVGTCADSECLVALSHEAYPTPAESGPHGLRTGGLSTTEQYATTFMQALAGEEVELNDNLQPIFARILARQLDDAEGQIEESGAFAQLVQVFTFVASPLDWRPNSPLAYGSAAMDAARAAAQGVDDATTGRLQITLEPVEAVEAGAQWRRANTNPWFNSGATETGIPVGGQTVEFKVIPNWTAPSNAAVSITAGQTTTLTRSYTNDPATYEPHHNVVLRVVYVTPDWMPYSSIDGWTQAVSEKESDNLKYYEATIWEEVDAVHLYEFSNDYDPWHGYWENLSEDEKIAYRETFRLALFDGMPPRSEQRSEFLADAFTEIARIIAQRHPESGHHLVYSGHGGPGGALFEAQLNPEDAARFLANWTDLINDKLGFIDMGGPCNKAGYSDLTNFCNFAYYYIASDLPNGGYTFDEFSMENYIATSPDYQYHRLFQEHEIFEDALKERIDIIRQRYLLSKNNMTENKVEQANYLFSCNNFAAFSHNFLGFLETADYTYYDDLLDVILRNSRNQQLINQYYQVVIHSATNKDFFQWDVEKNGIILDIHP